MASPPPSPPSNPPDSLSNPPPTPSPSSTPAASTTNPPSFPLQSTPTCTRNAHKPDEPATLAANLALAFKSPSLNESNPSTHLQVRASSQPPCRIPEEDPLGSGTRQQRAISAPAERWHGVEMDEGVRSEREGSQGTEDMRELLGRLKEVPEVPLLATRPEKVSLVAIGLTPEMLAACKLALGLKKEKSKSKPVASDVQETMTLAGSPTPKEQGPPQPSSSKGKVMDVSFILSPASRGSKPSAAQSQATTIIHGSSPADVGHNPLNPSTAQRNSTTTVPSDPPSPFTPQPESTASSSPDPPRYNPPNQSTSQHQSMFTAPASLPQLPDDTPQPGPPPADDPKPAKNGRISEICTYVPCEQFDALAVTTSSEVVENKFRCRFCRKISSTRRQHTVWKCNACGVTNLYEKFECKICLAARDVYDKVTWGWGVEGVGVVEEEFWYDLKLRRWMCALYREQDRVKLQKDQEMEQKRKRQKREKKKEQKKEKKDLIEV